MYAVAYNDKIWQNQGFTFMNFKDHNSMQEYAFECKFLIDILWWYEKIVCNF